MRPAGDPGSAAKNLCRVPAGCAPCIQSEGEDAQGEVQADDDEGGVLVSQVEIVNEIKSGMEDDQNEDCIQDTGYDILRGNKVTG